MQYKRKTKKHRASDVWKRRWYALASRIQDESSERGEYVSRPDALRKARATIKENRNGN